MLKRESKAKALCLAMKLEIEGYKSPAYYRLVNKFKNSKNYRFKADLLNFLKSTSAMTQRLYLQLLKDIDNNNITKINKKLAFKELINIFKRVLKIKLNNFKRKFLTMQMVEFCVVTVAVYSFIISI